MRLISWNVASLRARLPRVLELLEDLRPDVLALQETKCGRDQLPLLELAAAGYDVVDHSQGAWNGVAILTRHDGAGEPTDPLGGLPGEDDPTEARWIEATVGGIRVASVYVINGKALDHPDYRRKLSFLRAMAARAETLAAAGPTVILGDMNVCPTDADCYAPERFTGTTHTSPEERAALAGVLEAGGLVDAFIHHHGEGFPADDPKGVDGPRYTWWDYRAGSFHKNLGLRIDLALVDRATAERIERVWVSREHRKGTKPSDHAPLVVDLRD
ncbi:exodeoxyribonuclease III [Patulibacter brassicae]|uniref:Exodeoxyribonuclease III n=1 Tax=Patulibacter brassicae TaxID=1705717 RepID=A0ABU4VM81_9ACTN|nr:exodeoxyribonuclease III [Patulibacter brassicae]MDX8152946.1 exodeoxyribonuclease III [Patulibacter brassicae]